MRAGVIFFSFTIFSIMVTDFASGDRLSDVILCLELAVTLGKFFNVLSFSPLITKMWTLIVPT